MNVKTEAAWRDEQPELLARLREFAGLLENRPFENSEGVRGVSAFALYWFIKKIDPTIVFEIGVWRGFSTWIIEQAAPSAEVYCFDPILPIEYYLDKEKFGETYRSTRAHYSGQDFSCAEIPKTISKHSQPLAFFDDHQNKLPRLLQCRDAGVSNIIFDDNTFECYTHRTLEHDRHDPDLAVILEREIEVYETFPALWPVELKYGPLDIQESGIGFPFEPAFQKVYDDRNWHSYVTYVRLR